MHLPIETRFGGYSKSRVFALKHCLVVEDSHIIRQVACGILEDMQFYAEEATDSAAALEACRAQMPDCVLVDLPDTGRLEFLRALRRENSGSKPVVVFVILENNVDQIRDALNAGADDYLMKPFDRAALEAKLAEAGLMSAP